LATLIPFSTINETALDQAFQGFDNLMKSISGNIPNSPDFPVRYFAKPPMSYLLVVCLVMLVALLRYLIGLVDPNTLTFAAFFPVITLAAFLWGLKPSIFAIGLSTVVAWYFFLSPRGGFSTPDLGTTINLIIFVCSGGLIAHIGEAYHRALRECQKEEEKVSPPSRNGSPKPKHLRGGPGDCDPVLAE
jgi:hypothetical protein